MKTIHAIQNQYGVKIDFINGSYVITEGTLDFLGDYTKKLHPDLDYIPVNPYAYRKNFKGEALNCLIDLMPHAEGYYIQVSVGRRGHPYTKNV